MNLLLPFTAFAVAAMSSAQTTEANTTLLQTMYQNSEMAPYYVDEVYHENDPQKTYEKRTYPPVVWVTTQSNSNYAFNTLFRYISGNNERREKIEMTSPVLNTIPLSIGYSYEIAFYLPRAFQTNPPAPTDPNAVLKTYSNMTVYVRRYGGWSCRRSLQREYVKLVSALDGDKKSYRGEVVYAAGFDGPGSVGPRRNEIWLMVEN